MKRFLSFGDREQEFPSKNRNMIVRMETPVSILLVDDHQIFREGLKGILSDVSGITVTGEASDGWEAWQWLRENQADIVVTDISMKEMDGIDLTRRIKAEMPEQKVLVLSMYDDVSIIQEIFEAEADGYVLKNSGRNEFLTAINRIQAGNPYYSREVLDLLLKQNHKPEETQDTLTEILSPREVEILGLICEEYSTKEIAEKLFLSPRTVDSHRQAILRKTEARTLVGLVKVAYRYGLLSI